MKPRVRYSWETRSWENPATPLSMPDSWLVEVLGGGPVDAGVKVTEENSLRVMAVMACVRVISETLASLPLKVYNRGDGDDRTPTPTSPLYRLLHDAPNDYQTSYYWREVSQAHVLLWGNAYSYIERDGRGRVAALHPLMPWACSVERRGGQTIYTVQYEDGQTERYGSRDILHIPALGYDGLRGISPIQASRNTIGLSVAAERFGSRFFANDARPGLVLEHPQQLSEAARTHLSTSLQKRHGGSDNAHRPMVLEEGMKLTTVGVPPEDAQFLETRKFQVAEIARLYRVPPVMIGDLDRATFNNAEQQDLSFAKHTMRPWIVRWEQEINRKLFGAKSFTEFEMDGLLRGDFKTRMEGHAIAVQWGIETRNEVRRLENRPALDGLDDPLTPLNMIAGDDDAEDGNQDDETPGNPSE